MFFFSFVPGLLKCKNDRALPGGRLCATCSSPRHLNGTELPAVEHLVCHSPVIRPHHRTDSESEMLSTEDFKEPLGNVSLNLSDEHGNKVDVYCSVGEPEGPTKISWEQVSLHQLVTNISFSVQLECPVDRAKYEQMWRLIAYYSSVPARLKREVILSQTPQQTHTYRQDSTQETLYYTGVEVKMKARPAWLMQPSVDLQLNKALSSANSIRLILSANLSKTVDSELERRQRRTWVMIESTNRTRRVQSAVVGGSSEMHCNVHGSDQPTVQWMLPDGSKLESAHSSVDSRLFVSKDGRLVVKAVTHKDMGIYYCISRVHGDLAVLPFYLAVHQSSSPPLGKETSITSTEEDPGNPISLDCMASGSPDADISWILPSNDIVSVHTNSSKGLVYSNGTLYIPEVQLADSGYYKCVAINPLGVDTLVKKITVAGDKGLIQPLWAFPTGPQSASGISTQIKVPTGNTVEEASGDVEVTQDGAPMSRSDPIRRRITGGVVPGRRVVHPSRKMWQRPPPLRKPMQSNPKDRKIVVGNRRRVNISKGKIDPKKWADILGKIRGRNTQNSVTETPVQFATQSKVMEHTEPLKTLNKSDSVTEHEGDSQDPSMAHSQGVYETPESYTVHSPHDLTSNSQNTNSMQTTIKPQITQTTQRKSDQHTSSDVLFYLPETTSASSHAITAWQVDRDPLTRSSIENSSINTEADRDKTAHRSKELKKRKNKVKPKGAARFKNKRKHFSGKNQTVSSVNLQSGSDFSETSTTPQFHPGPRDPTVSALKTEAVLTTASLRTSTVPSSVRKGGSERRRPSSQRKNGERKKKAKRRKYVLKTPGQLFPTTPVNTPPSVVNTAVFTELEPEELKLTVSSIVPFTESQVAPLGTQSHEENTVYRREYDVSIQPSLLPSKDAPLLITNPLFQTTAATVFPPASPGTDHERTMSHAALDIFESASPPEISEAVTLISQPKATNSLHWLDKPSEDSQESSVVPEMEPSNPSVQGFQTGTLLPTDVKNNPSANQHRLSLKVGEMLWDETGTGSSFLPPPLTTAASVVELGTTPSRDTSSAFNKTPSRTSEQDSETEEVSASTPTVSNTLYQNDILKTESKIDQSLKETPKTWNKETAPTSSTSVTSYSVTTSRAMLPVTKADMSSTGADTTPSLRFTTHNPQILVNRTLDQQINLISATLTSNRKNSLHPTKPSQSQELAVTNPTSADAELYNTQTSTITSTVLQSTPAEQGSEPRGKPTITKKSFQTITVKAGTHAQLPCQVEGQPRPFLSWTKVATGMYDSMQ